MAESLPITVLIATKNEEPNIEKCLSSLKPAQKVIVLDSHSEDRTSSIALEMGCEVVQFDYIGGYPKKRQWALESLVILTPWVMLLDADEMVPHKLWKEIEEAINVDKCPEAFLITKGFHFLGKKFKYGGFSHSAILLFKNGVAKFEHIIDEPASAPDIEIHERLIVDGRVGELKTPLIHEDFKGLEAYIARHNAYSTWEANVRHVFLMSGKWGNDSIRPNLFGNSQERRRFLKELVLRIPYEQLVWFVYHYFFKLGFLEGRAGLIACQIRASYIAQVRAKLFELRQKKRHQ